jgi:glycosyltransferase involved in cell wall biosynthesis
LVDGISQKKILLSENIVTETKSIVLGKGSIGGVDIERFKGDMNIRAKIRQELGLNDDAILFIFLGRLNKDKGIFTLAEAFNRLNKRHPNVHLIYVGPDEGIYEEKIIEMVDDRTNLIFYGATEVPEHLFSAADIFCLPSFREGFGSSVIEASAVSLPVICSNVYGMEDAFIHNKTGLRHLVNNSDDLYLQMKLLVENPEMRRKLGDAGRKYVIENFNQKYISKLFRDYYLENLGRN